MTFVILQRSIQTKKFYSLGKTEFFRHFIIYNVFKIQCKILCLVIYYFQCNVYQITIGSEVFFM